MKFSSIAVAVLAAAAKSRPASAQSYATQEEAQTPVRIGVSCVGADLSALSLPKGSVVGRILEDTYNTVVADDDNDDSELSEVSFVGSRATRFDVLTKAGFWTGSWGCDLCSKDDDSETKLWEKTLASSLVATGDEDFRGVKSCTIDLTVDATADDADLNADIEVNCGRAVNLHALGVAKGTFLAHAVQRSYSKVHGSIVDDDSKLEAVTYHAPQPVLEDESNLERQPRPRNLNGLYSLCYMCPRFDDMLFGEEVEVAVSMAWGAELTTMLRQSPFPAFRKISKCVIKLKPRDVFADEPSEVTTKVAKKDGKEKGQVQKSAAAKKVRKAKTSVKGQDDESRKLAKSKDAGKEKESKQEKDRKLGTKSKDAGKEKESKQEKDRKLATKSKEASKEKESKQEKDRKLATKSKDAGKEKESKQEKDRKLATKSKEASKEKESKQEKDRKLAKDKEASKTTPTKYVKNRKLAKKEQ